MSGPHPCRVRGHGHIDTRTLCDIPLINTVNIGKHHGNRIIQGFRDFPTNLAGEEKRTRQQRALEHGNIGIVCALDNLFGHDAATHGQHGRRTGAAHLIFQRHGKMRRVGNHRRRFTNLRQGLALFAGIGRGFHLHTANFGLHFG